MKQFEYKVVKLSDYEIQYRDALKPYGKDGWELVSVTKEYESSKMYFFKREIQNNIDKSVFNNDAFDEGI